MTVQHNIASLSYNPEGNLELKVFGQSTKKVIL